MLSPFIRTCATRNIEMDDDFLLLLRIEYNHALYYYKNEEFRPGAEKGLTAMDPENLSDEERRLLDAVHADPGLLEKVIAILANQE